ncbi:MAG TPA: FHA domain-containing protein [Anaerolineaceae bacterium]|jgi:hypothetical protein|nr:FHA domain-containing protein [Anaerolineaceae bacterium]HQH84624.1 FHA domain-containing protein [Anaerolineaceae bacterium]
MKLPFDQIEAKLQALVERRLTLFKRVEPQHQLIHALAEALNAVDNCQNAPELFTIHLHPEGAAYWQSHPEALAELGRALQATSQGTQCLLVTAPLIRVLADPTLAPGEVRVETGQRQVSSSETAVLRIPADELPPPPQPSPRKAYLILPGDQVYWLALPVVNIGRRGDNQLVLSDLQISRNHAQVRLVHGQFIIFDLDSTSGTFVNGNPVREHALRPGDVITLGSIALIYGEDVPDTPTAGNQTAAMIDK